MEKESIILVGVIAATTVPVCLLCIKLNEYFAEFNRKTRDIVFRLDRTENKAEYNFLLAKLRCHYLTVIPFVNEITAERIYPKIFGRAKNKNIGFMYAVAPSVISICICAVCLCGMSWAWFTASTDTGVASIKSAYLNFDLQVAEDENIIHKNPETDSYVLVSGKTYSVAFTVSGNASTGFAHIVFQGKPYFTPQLKGGDRFEFTLKPDSDGELAVSWQWGMCSVENRLENGCILESNALPAERENVSASTSEPAVTPEPASTSEPAVTPEPASTPEPAATSGTEISEAAS